MTNRRILRSIILMILSGVGLLASADEPQIINIVADSYSFKPDTITVKAGHPVTLNVKNDATLLPHNLVIKAPETGVDVTIEVKAGKTASATFTPATPGTWEIYCSKEPPFGKSHRERGMHGKLIVE
jgi:plastocyanin